MSEQKHPLHTLFWECTLRCNAYCEFCGSRCGEVNVPDLDGDVVLRALEQVAQAYDASQIMINVTGGEPLLRRDLFEVMAGAAALGFPWGMVTNGTLITDEVISRMQETHMRTISISLDGTEKVHEAARRLPGGSAKITDAIRRLKAADFLDCIQVTTVVSKHTLGELEALYPLLCDLGVDDWRIATVDPIGRGAQEELLLDADDRRQLLAFLDKHAFSGHMAVHTSCSHYLGAWDRLYRAHPFHCRTGMNVASILANGDLFVCPNVPRRPELIQGNITRDDIVQVWENEYGWFRDPDRQRQGRCADCPSYEQCRGDSLHTWDFERCGPKICYLDNAWEEPVREDRLPPELLTVLRKQLGHVRGLRMGYGSGSGKQVLLLPEAARMLHLFFHWGQRHPANLSELMVGMVGWRRDNRAFVAGLVPVWLQSRSADQAVFTEESHGRMLRELDLMNASLPDADEDLRAMDGPYELLGYLHSHPGDLTPEMSLPDRMLHSRMREELHPDYITGVMNPQQKEMRFYWDSAYMPVDAVLLMDEGETPKWT